MEPNKTRVQLRPGEMPMDYFLWNSAQGVPLCGAVEGGFIIKKHEIREAPLRMEGEPRNQREFEESIQQGFVKNIIQLGEQLNIPLTAINNLLASLQITHPVQHGFYYNYRNQLVFLKGVKNWSGYWDWNGDIKFGKTKILDKYAISSIKEFERIAKLGKWLGRAQLSINAITIYDEWGNILRGTFNPSMIMADSTFIIIGLKGGPWGMAISCIYATIDVAFEKDNVGGVERSLNCLREKLYNIYAPVGANIDAYIKNMINFKYYF